MKRMISKTTFLQFQMCPKDIWLTLHKPELLDQFKRTQFELHQMEQGNKVEAWARKLFPHGRLITATDDEACFETQRLMGESKDAIFQPTFVAEGFIAKCDFLVRSGSAWNIYEIKVTNSKKKGMKIAIISLIWHSNPSYS
jgi:predicted RecB family nuclease